MKDFFTSFLEQIETFAETQEVWAYVLIGFSAFLENIFPPIPGDMVNVFGAFLVGRGFLSFGAVLFSSTVGSLLGFMSLFYLGYRGGEWYKSRQKESSMKKIEKVTVWMNRYGYWVILANRFLPGLRSIISFVAGFLKMSPLKVFGVSLISCLLWNTLLLYLGVLAGNNWETLLSQVGRYSFIVFGVLVVVLLSWLFFGLRRIRRNRLKKI